MSIVIVLSERQQVETVVVNLNAQYTYFIKHIFPNAQVIIDRFHIVQLTARALDKCRTTLVSHINKHSREYKLLKSHWKLFHKYEKEIIDDKLVFLNGINEYMTQRNALDLIFNFSPKFKQVYQVYQGILEATREKISQSFMMLSSDTKCHGYRCFNSEGKYSLH
ncbi:transposase [Ligilactobacillus aviarius]|uniref:transposase n=1 Tax=Ligilactobacillus aviarius TaxID=1606 RepID=UPI0024BA9CF5|nr:transposase [Ligilactobacillus aviarius]